MEPINKMKNKLFVIALATAAILSGCEKYDDTDVRSDISDLRNRVTALETWCETAKSQIGSLQGLVTALEGKNFITGVTPVMEGSQEVGYTITFQTGNPITIKNGKDGQNGKDGATPKIGVSKDKTTPSDGNYYWTVQVGDDEPTFILNGDKKIPVTGNEGTSGHTPVLSVAEYNGTLYWQVDGEWLLNGTKKVPATGEKGDSGDAVFQRDGIDYESDPDNVIFTLADGTTLTLPRTRTLTVSFDSYETFILTPTTGDIGIVLPTTLREEGYTALIAEISSEGRTDMDIVTRAEATPWTVKLTEPSFVNGVYQKDAKATVTASVGAVNGDKAILKITLIDSNGQETSTSRVLEYFSGTIADVSQAGGLSTALADATKTDIKELKVAGTLNETDFEYIRENLTALKTLDLSGTDMTVFPDRALRFDNPNSTITEVILPEGLTTIGYAAFANCSALEKLNVPSSVTTLGRYMLENTKVTSFTIPSGVTEIPDRCFSRSALITIEIPESVTSIGEWAFEAIEDQPTLQSVTIKANISEIPECCFLYQEKLTSLSLPDGIVSIGADAFSCCKVSSLTLPSSLQKIGVRAFSFNSITTLTLPKNVTTIGFGAFAGNDIPTIDLPASIESVHRVAFKWESATTVICRAATVPETPDGDDNNNTWSLFHQINKDCVLKVPAESLNAYKDAWGSYFKEVQAIE